MQVVNANYQINVINGNGSVLVSGLKANTYVATALFKSDGIFNDNTKTATFKVTSKQSSSKECHQIDFEEGQSSSNSRAKNILEKPIRRVLPRSPSRRRY